MNTQELNALIQETCKNLKHYPKEPTYYLSIYSGACSYEILVNGLPLYKYYGSDNSGGNAIPINRNILKSGIQSLKVRILPAAIIKEARFLPVIGEDIVFTLKLEVTDWKAGTEMKVLDTVFTIPQVMKEGRYVYKDGALPAAVYERTFKAEVPYELKGWSKSVDLSKEDSNKLKAEVIAAYEKIMNKMENKDVLGEYEFDSTRLLEYMQSMYRKPKVLRMLLKKITGCTTQMILELIAL